MQERCRRDITLLKLKEKDQERSIGSVRYHAFSDSALARLVSHYQDLGHFTGVKRGSSFQCVASGKMFAEGFRVPQGGRPGDTYSGHKTTGLPSEVEGAIAALPHLFRTAKVCYSLSFRTDADNDQDTDIVMTALRHTAPDISKDIDISQQKSHMFPLGKYGINAFYCYNYLAPQHYNRDRTWTISIQTGKKCTNWPVRFFLYSLWCYFAHREQHVVVSNCLRPTLHFTYYL